jgi:aminopeptidase N
MRRLLVLLAFLTAGNMQAAPPPEGIPRELARQRAAQLSDIRYHLRFTLIPRATSVSGHEDLQFRSTSSEAVLLDFREGAVTNLAVNGSLIPAKIENGHIELPASAIHTGENAVSMDFSAPVATAGKAITRFEDKDDNTEYLYTLFVPMDAEMAFPCFDQPDLKGRFHLELTAPESWMPISNTPIESQSPADAGQRLTIFQRHAPSARISLHSQPGRSARFTKLPGSPASSFASPNSAKLKRKPPKCSKLLRKASTISPNSSGSLSRFQNMTSS